MSRYVVYIKRPSGKEEIICDTSQFKTAQIMFETASRQYSNVHFKEV